MTFVTGVVLVTIPLGSLLFFLFFGLDSHVVAATATSTAFYQLVRSCMCCRESVEGGPAEVMLACGKFVELFFMALSTDVLVRQYCFCIVICGLVIATVTGGAGYIFF